MSDRCDAAAIEATRRLLPIGFWKGSGLALMLDLIAALLSGGHATHQITPDPERETNLSQVFIAIGPSAAGGTAAREATFSKIGMFAPQRMTWASKWVDVPLSMLAVSMPTDLMRRWSTSQLAASGERPGNVSAATASGPRLLVPR